jgi:hypothetical protein
MKVKKAANNDEAGPSNALVNRAGNGNDDVLF